MVVKGNETTVHVPGINDSGLLTIYVWSLLYANLGKEKSKVALYL